MRNLLFLTVSILLLSSCACFDLSAPEMRGNEKFEIKKVDGNKITLNAKADMYNENCFSVKIKPSNLDLIIDGENVGTVRLDKKVKLKSKQESTIDANLTATLSEGVMKKALKYATKSEIEVQLKGKVKGGIFIFSKKFEINETRTISGSSLLQGF